MSLVKNHNILRISPTDGVNGFIVTKFKSGENVQINIEPHPAFGEQIVISANKSQGRNVQTLDCDGVVDNNTYLVLVDASKNPVKVFLPVAYDYLGQLSIVCVDASHGIELVPNAATQNVIFDVSNADFHAKGDSLTLISDRGSSEPAIVEEPAETDSPEADLVEGQCAPLLFPGTWYIVGRYAAQWYA
jgi:hypothetical protein